MLIIIVLYFVRFTARHYGGRRFVNVTLPHKSTTRTGSRIECGMHPIGACYLYGCRCDLPRPLDRLLRGIVDANLRPVGEKFISADERRCRLLRPFKAIGTWRSLAIRVIPRPLPSASQPRRKVATLLRRRLVSRFSHQVSPVYLQCFERIESICMDSIYGRWHDEELITPLVLSINDDVKTSAADANYC